HGCRIGHNRRRCLTVFGGSALVRGLVAVAAVLIPGPPEDFGKDVPPAPSVGDFQSHMTSDHRRHRDALPGSPASTSARTAAVGLSFDLKAFFVDRAVMPTTEHC